jgi:hypothetical protein
MDDRMFACVYPRLVLVRHNHGVRTDAARPRHIDLGGVSSSIV